MKPTPPAFPGYYMPTNAMARTREQAELADLRWVAAHLLAEHARLAAPHACLCPVCRHAGEWVQPQAAIPHPPTCWWGRAPTARAAMAKSYPPNTHDLDVRVRITLPPGETVDQQDIILLITGEELEPWPGVEIHDLDLLAHRPAEVYPLEGAERLSAWFGLSYASFLTLPRVLMEAMPDHWRGRMAALLEEYDEAFPNKPDLGSRVQITQDGKLVKTPAWLLNYRHPDRSAIDALRPNSEP